MRTVAVITGVASGIGRYVAYSLRKCDVDVYGLDINEPELEGIHFFKCDISVENQVVNVVKKIKQLVSKVDYLLNVAGILCYKNRYYVKDLPLNEWERVITTNLTSVYLMTKYFIPLLEKSKYGVIINFSSEQVCHIRKKSVPYSVSKAAVEMFTRVVALELLEKGIRANTIALASVRTNFIKDYVRSEKKFQEMMRLSEKKMPLGLIEPKDVYCLIKYLISNDNKMTGQTIILDSGVILGEINKE